MAAAFDDRRKVARAPLFDRLVDSEPARPYEPDPFRTLDRDGLIRSVMREVSLLLNTRCPVSTAVLKTRKRGALDYGIPDLSYFRPRDPDSEAELARILVATIEAYEPRLANVHVEIAAISRDHNTMTVQVDGMLVVGREREPLSFSVALGLAEDASGGGE